MTTIYFPTNEQQLLNRAQLVAGYTFGEIAHYLNMPVPNNLNKQKGWAGNLIETFLGANAGSK
ncbi:hypothetical protein GASC598B02_003630, partial [Gilliamella apicola SCGC AB-598-B02]